MFVASSTALFVVAASVAALACFAASSILAKATSFSSWVASLLLLTNDFWFKTAVSIACFASDFLTISGWILLIELILCACTSSTPSLFVDWSISLSAFLTSSVTLWIAASFSSCVASLFWLISAFLASAACSIAFFAFAFLITSASILLMMLMPLVWAWSTSLLDVAWSINAFALLASSVALAIATSFSSWVAS